MGCGPGVAGKSRSAGVFVVSIIFSTRTPGSITRESAAPAPRLMMAAKTIQSLMFFISLWFCGRSNCSLLLTPLERGSHALF